MRLRTALTGISRQGRKVEKLSLLACACGKEQFGLLQEYSTTHHLPGHKLRSTEPTSGTCCRIPSPAKEKRSQTQKNLKSAAATTSAKSGILVKKHERMRPTEERTILESVYPFRKPTTSPYISSASQRICGSAYVHTSWQGTAFCLSPVRESPSPPIPVALSKGLFPRGAFHRR